MGIRLIALRGDSPDLAPPPALGVSGSMCVSHSSVVRFRLVRQSGCLHDVDLTGDGPGETQQFACDRRDDERKRFALGREAPVAGAKSDLCLPGNVTYFHWHPFETIEQDAAHP